MKTTMKRPATLLGLLTLLLLTTLLGGCTQAGELQTVTEEVPLDGSQQATVILAMGAGQLEVDGGAAALMEGEFSYNVEEWEPLFDYVEAGDALEVTVSQPETEGINTPAGAENLWDVALNEDVPLALTIRLGAGEGDLNLAPLDLRALTLETGASRVNLDLAGQWREDLEAEIRGGVGDLTILLPASTGVRVNVDQALGAVDAEGLSQQGDYLVNDAYGQEGATLDLNIESGIGSITLETAG